MKMNPVIFREYDIRGIFERDFDLSFVNQLGRSYATYLKKTFPDRSDLTITVGHDARSSSPFICDALCDGLKKSGVSVLRLGLITSPMSYFSTYAIEHISGAIMITGSHNPPDYNGFKISVGNKTIFGDAIKDLQKIIEKGNFSSGQGTDEEYDIFPEYVARYSDEFKGLKRLPIVLDCGNGAGGIVARRLYSACGLDPEILFEEPDGTFPNHHPDPTVEENLQDLIKAVRERGAIAGIGFDGDADRIGLVDDQGNIILGDEILALCSISILKVLPGAKIVGDVKCSDRVFEFIRAHGGNPIMWKTGHSLVKEKIREEKAPFGGELSGHIFFSDRNYGFDDALYAGLRVIEVLSQSGKRIKDLLKDLPSSFNTPEIRIDTTEEKKHLIVDALKKKFSGDPRFKVNLIDGIRVSFQGGWALARASNTQPVLVLRFEATSPQLLAEIKGEFESVVNSIL